MSRALVLALFLYILLFLALVSLRGPLLALAIPLFVYLAAGLLMGPRAVTLAVERTLSAERVPAGAPLQIKVSVTNRGPDLESLFLEDLLPAGVSWAAGSRRAIVKLERGATLELEYTVQGERGLHQMQGLRASASDPLLLFHTGVFLPAQERVYVLPHPERLPSVAIRPHRTRVYTGQIPARKGGAGIEFFGVREYQPGDPLRWINHRAGSRYPDSLFVNEFEQERAADVGIILDVRSVTNSCVGGHSLLEYGVQATATLADTLLSQGNRVGLFLYGGAVDWTFPGYGKIQRERILQSLARAREEEHQVFQHLSYLPTRLFPVRSQLVLVSPLRPEDVADLTELRGRGYHLLAVVPDPIGFESSLLGDSSAVQAAARLARLERLQLFRQLSQAGVRTFEWQVETPFHQTAHHVLSRLPYWHRGPEVR